MPQSAKHPLSSIAVPAKVILFGEHAVVYPGNHAILWPVKSLQVVTSTFSADSPDEYTLVMTDGTQTIPFSDLTNTLLEFADLKGYAKTCLSIAHEYISEFKKPIPLQIRLESNIPMGGFGSSASTAASIIKALVTANDLPLNQQTWFDLVMQAEKLPHANPSGADAAVVTMQKPIIVTKRADGLVDIEAIKETKGLQKIAQKMQFIHTGRPRELTGHVVEFVSLQSNSKKTLNLIEDNTRQVIEAIRNGNDSMEKYKQWINNNGKLLEELGVVPQKLAAKAADLRRKGMSIKLSGAGALSGEAGGVMIYLGTGKPSL